MSAAREARVLEWWGTKKMRLRTAGSRWGRLALVGVLAGALVGIVVLPAGTVLGLAAQRGAIAYADLPSNLQTSTLPQTSRLYASDGKTLITTFADENRTTVTLDQVAPVMRQAIVAAEDTRFYEHNGVDFKGLARALVANGGSGEVQQGASTLTMQYVRNVLKTDPSLTPEQRADATDETAGRKIQEIRYAVALEKQLTKDQILERYLNIAYFGAGAYGVEAASETYFGHSASQLTLAEVGAARRPGAVSRHGQPAQQRPAGGAGPALVRARLDGQDEGDHGRPGHRCQGGADRAGPGRRAAEWLCERDHTSWGFYCDYFVQWWESQPAFGTTVTERLTALRQGGYKIVTALDPTVQASAVAQSLSVYGYNNAKALPIAVVQPGSGRVLAMAVNRHYSLAADPDGHNGYPNTVNQLVAGGGDITGYQAGSTFKMFTMLAALQSGMALNTSFNAPSPLVTKWRDSGPGNCGGYYCPVNDNPAWMDGQRTMWNGFGRSVNTYFVWLEEQVGPAAAVAMAEKLGITFRAASDQAMATNSADDWGAFTLGVANTTPLDLAEAYATVAADGKYCAPLPVTGITDAAGNPVAAASPQCSPGDRPGDRPRGNGCGALPGGPAERVRPVRRGYRHQRRAALQGPAAGRQDGQRGEPRDRDVRRVHPTGGRGRNRGRSGGRHQGGRFGGRVRRCRGGGQGTADRRQWTAQGAVPATGHGGSLRATVGNLQPLLCGRVDHCAGANSHHRAG